jgi:hypothetical protein
MVVTGVDINEVAIGAAREGAANVQPPITFIAADLLPEPAVVNERSFDAVLLIRFLTCFPDEGERRRLVNRAKAAVKIGGILYVRDFLLSAGYRKRYDEAARDGMSFGNFTVLTEDGSVRFVAYHHTEHEAMAMLSGCELISFRTEESLSMNGNPCTMFELMARRTGT